MIFFFKTDWLGGDFYFWASVFFPTIIDVFVKYKKFEKDGVFREAKRGKHHLDKNTYIWKATILLSIQLIIIVVLFYLLMFKYQAG